MEIKTTRFNTAPKSRLRTVALLGFAFILTAQFVPSSATQGQTNQLNSSAQWITTHRKALTLTNKRWYSLMKFEEDAADVANRQRCSPGYQVVRSTFGESSTYACYAPAKLASFPKCALPTDPQIPYCIFTQDTTASISNDGQVFNADAAAVVAAARVERYDITLAEEALIFNLVDAHEKKPADYLKKNFGPKNSSPVTLSMGTDGIPVPTSGILAFNTPEWAAAARKASGQKIISLKLKAKTKLARLSALIYLRDKAMPLRFGPTLGLNDELESQKQIFLNEIVAQLQVSGFIDDTQPDINGVVASKRGCVHYKNSRVFITDSSAIDTDESDLSLGRRPRGDLEKIDARFISYWYTLSGLTPFVRPAVMTNPFGDETTRFINQRLLTCSKMTAIEDLPNLAKLAPHFLAEMNAKYVHSTARKMHAYHWVEASRLSPSLSPTETPLISDPNVLNYLELHWRKFFFEQPHGDSAGNGLYFSLVPTTTNRYGAVAIALTLPPGTKFISYLNRGEARFSPEADEELKKLNCTGEHGHDLAYMMAIPSNDCIKVAHALVITLNIAFAVYYYDETEPLKDCVDASIPPWSIVVFGPELLNPSHVTLYNKYDTSLATSPDKEQRMVAEYFRQSSLARYSSDDVVTKGTATADNSAVSSKEFKDWLNTEILGCGMGKDWQKLWR